MASLGGLTGGVFEMKIIMYPGLLILYLAPVYYVLYLCILCTFSVHEVFSSLFLIEIRMLHV